jgi:hypothetical protein
MDDYVCVTKKQVKQVTDDNVAGATHIQCPHPLKLHCAGGPSRS